ncbi:aminotransferase [Mesorhizobium sp. C277A]|uniref:hypothetical protein n=1 Tax=Mesorhizobium TaxID=68287 RepID=UPI0003D05D3F|nr:MULTISPECIES: hypothetical protein [unclassified Mesorhizobium]ESY90331.1 aminotransferase [Mesorhizobium sp. LNHC209A00]
MHTVKPPQELLDEWLEPFPSVEGQYGHTLLEQLIPSDDHVRAGLTPYFESAHLDARTCFHEFASISLHPDDGESGCNAQYPNALPPISRRGLFGEVISGLVTQAYSFVGEHEWLLPVFLFRNHEDARQYLFQLVRDPARQRQVQGRKGDDFIAICVDEDGKVTRFIAGEAKWRATWNNSELDKVMLGDTVKDPDTKKAQRDDDGKVIRDGRGVWFEINRAIKVPTGVKQLQMILEECAKAEFETVIESLDRILLPTDPDPSERTDLILLAGGTGPARAKGSPLIDWEEMPTEYTAGRDLQVVELLLKDGDALIDAIYDGLWADDDDDD